MSYRAVQVLRWIRYGEYVLAWEPIPITERPRYAVRLVDGEWQAVLR